jgi:hypothetical protein
MEIEIEKMRAALELLGNEIANAECARDRADYNWSTLATDTTATEGMAAEIKTLKLARLSQEYEHAYRICECLREIRLRVVREGMLGTYSQEVPITGTRRLRLDDM